MNELFKKYTTVLVFILFVCIAPFWYVGEAFIKCLIDICDAISHPKRSLSCLYRKMWKS